MAKSLRSKRARKMRAIKRVRYGEKELVRLKNMVEEAEKSNLKESNSGFKLVSPPSASAVPAPEVEEQMDTTVARTTNPKTMRDEHGNYPVWFNQRRIKRIQKTRKKKAQRHKMRKTKRS